MGSGAKIALVALLILMVVAVAKFVQTGKDEDPPVNGPVAGAVTGAGAAGLKKDGAPRLAPPGSAPGPLSGSGVRSLITNRPQAPPRDEGPRTSGNLPSPSPPGLSSAGASPAGEGPGPIVSSSGSSPGPILLADAAGKSGGGAGGSPGSAVGGSPAPSRPEQGPGGGSRLLPAQPPQVNRNPAPPRDPQTSPAPPPPVAGLRSSEPATEAGGSGAPIPRETPRESPGTPPSAERVTFPLTHAVEEGDSYWRIAERYYGAGKGRLHGVISTANGGVKLIAGKSIKVPPPPEGAAADLPPARPPAAAGRAGGVVSSDARYDYYVVQRGDTLSGIAQRFYGSSRDTTAIEGANPSLRYETLREGDKIRIPRR